MHKNHRRKNKYRAKHHGYYGWLNLYSLKSFKVVEARRRRAREQELLRHGKYDQIPVKVQKDILWNYW